MFDRCESGIKSSHLTLGKEKKAKNETTPLRHTKALFLSCHTRRLDNTARAPVLLSLPACLVTRREGLFCPVKYRALPRLNLSHSPYIRSIQKGQHFSRISASDVRAGEKNDRRSLQTCHICIFALWLKRLYDRCRRRSLSRSCHHPESYKLCRITRSPSLSVSIPPAGHRADGGSGGR